MLIIFKTAQIEARPKSAHRYNVAEQQQIYKEEIARIWKAQLDSLSNKEEPVLSDHEEEEEEQPDSPSAVSCLPNIRFNSHNMFDISLNTIGVDKETVMVFLLHQQRHLTTATDLIELLLNWMMMISLLQGA